MKAKEKPSALRGPESAKQTRDKENLDCSLKYKRSGNSHSGSDPKSVREIMDRMPLFDELKRRKMG